MATHSSVLAWRISGTEEPGGLPCMGSHRVGHDWSDLAAAAAAYLIKVYLNLILLSFIQEGSLVPETQTHRTEGHMKTQAKNGVYHIQAKEYKKCHECQEMPECRKGKEGVSLQPLERASLCQQFWTLASKLGESISIILSHPVCSTYS